jgi:ATP-dependent DNA helicase RecQ
MERAQRILRETFGYDSFRHNQAGVIQSLLEGRDVLTLMPTGGGKSLCYQIPAMVRPGTGIVISPLIALMQDQVGSLRQLGIRAAFLNSTQEREEQQWIESSLRNGGLDLLYVAPERLLGEYTLSLLDQAHIALFAIDEAHCVSQWGHDFRKEYQQLTVLAERYPGVPRIALTATADDRTRKEIVSQLALQGAAVFIDSFDRPNIRYAIAEGQNAREQLWRFLEREHPRDAGIVYCLSRKRVEQTADWLNGKGRTALAYHAGLPDELRRENQERFLREDGIIVVATIAFGMGIDKPDVRFVAHLNLPKNIEAYYQETGRAGRDGEPADAWLAYGLQDVILLRQMVNASDGNEQFKRVANHKLEAMLGLCEMTGCRRQALLAYFDEQLEEACGNCDNCLSPPETWNATVEAQKALSCVYRTGQRFGVNYVVDVLTGKDDERIKRFRHDRLSTFGIGRELTAVEWRVLFRQLIAHGYLSIDVEGHGALQLSDTCRPLLKGEMELQLRRQSRPERKQPKEKTPQGDKVRSVDQPLFDQLRDKRLALASEQGVPPYVIFHDTTLREMARKRPLSLDAMAGISGVGNHKLQHYGETFLQIIAEHPLPELLDNNLSDTVNESLRLHLQGMSLEAIADHRELSKSTIYGHFSEAIESGLLDMAEVLDMDQREIDRIVDAAEMLSICEDGKLKPLFEALDGSYDYGILRCVVAEICG